MGKRSFQGNLNTTTDKVLTASFMNSKERSTMHDIRGTEHLPPPSNRNTKGFSDFIKTNFFLTGLKTYHSNQPKNSGAIDHVPLFQKTMAANRRHNDLIKTLYAKNKFYLSNYDLMMSKNFKMGSFDRNIQNQFPRTIKRENMRGVLKNLRLAIEDKSKKEVELIQRKNSNFVTAMNKLIYQRREAHTKLQNLKKEFTELDQQVISEHDEFRVRYIELQKKIEQAEKDFEEKRRLENRLQMIIKICKKNKNMNEEWINVRLPDKGFFFRIFSE